jgi:type VI secretion system secreted protein VgrG
MDDESGRVAGAGGEGFGAGLPLGGADAGTPEGTARSVLAGVSQGVQIASAVVAAVDAGLEGAERPPVDPGAVASDVLGGLGSALGGAAGIASGIDPGVASALALGGSLSSTVGAALGAAQSIIESIASMDARANRHSVRYAFTSAADPDAELAVVSFTLTERLGAPYVLRLTLAIEDLDFRARTLLGRDCTLTMSRGESERKVHGLVRSVERGRTTDRRRVMTVEIVPALAALELRRDSRVFQQLTVTEIVDTVLGALEGYGRDNELRTHRTYPVREHCVQYMETDLDFVHRLLEEEGITYFFDHSGEKEKMILVDDAHGHVPLFDDDARVPFVEQRGETSETEHVHELVRTDQLRATSFALRDVDWTQHAGGSVVEEQDTGEDEQGRARELFEHDRAVTLDRWDGRAFGRDDRWDQLRIRGEEHLAVMDVLRGTGNVIAFAPGTTFAIENHPVRELDTDLLLVSVEHRGQSAQLRDMLGGAAFADDEVSYECSFVCIPKDTPFRPRRATPKPRIHGLLSAVVVGANGQEIHSDVHRRVRVQMRWDRLGTFDDRSSCFVRVLQPWAGAGFGASFLPRVGMEVAIAFLDGDPDRPVVSGCLYNADNPPPYTESADWTKSTLKSKSSPASSDGAEHFNELRFEDAAGSEQIFVHAEKDLDEEILHDHTTHVGRNQTNRVDADQSETVGGDQSLIVRQDRMAVVQGDETLGVVGNRKTVIETDETLLVHGKYHATVEGTRDLHVREKNAESYRGERHVWVNRRDFQTVDGQSELHVHGWRDVVVDEHHKIKKGATELTVSDSIYGSAPGHEVVFEVSGTFIKILRDGRVQISAESELSLVCGGASLTLSSSGAVSVAGTDVSVSGSDVTVSGTTSVAATSGSSTLELAISGANLAGPIVRIN